MDKFIENRGDIMFMVLMYLIVIYSFVNGWKTISFITAMLAWAVFYAVTLMQSHIANLKELLRDREDNDYQ